MSTIVLAIAGTVHKIIVYPTPVAKQSQERVKQVREMEIMELDNIQVIDTMGI